MIKVLLMGVWLAIREHAESEFGAALLSESPDKNSNSKSVLK